MDKDYIIVGAILLGISYYIAAYTHVFTGIVFSPIIALVGFIVLVIGLVKSPKGRR